MRIDDENRIKTNIRMDMDILNANLKSPVFQNEPILKKLFSILWKKERQNLHQDYPAAQITAQGIAFPLSEFGDKLKKLYDKGISTKALVTFIPKWDTYSRAMFRAHGAEAFDDYLVKDYAVVLTNIINNKTMSGDTRKVFKRIYWNVLMELVPKIEKMKQFTPEKEAQISLEYKREFNNIREIFRKNKYRGVRVIALGRAFPSLDKETIESMVNQSYPRGASLVLLAKKYDIALNTVKDIVWRGDEKARARKEQKIKRKIIARVLRKHHSVKSSAN